VLGCCSDLSVELPKDPPQPMPTPFTHLHTHTEYSLL